MKDSLVFFFLRHTAVAKVVARRGKFPCMIIKCTAMNGHTSQSVLFLFQLAHQSLTTLHIYSFAAIELENCRELNTYALLHARLLQLEKMKLFPPFGFFNLHLKNLSCYKIQLSK